VPRLLRRVLVPLAAVLAVVLVAATVLGVGLVRRSFPVTEGELPLAGLGAEVEVVRDELGVAHIYADTAEDLFRGQGYVAAQDRFFEMDLRRHTTAGRLAELVGEGGLETDRVIRTMGWRRVAEQELALLDPTARRYLQAYSAGVNAYLAANPSPSQVSLEYVVLAQSAPGYQIEPWDEVDSLAWLKAMAWDLRGNYRDELARARLAGEVSLAQLGSLYPDYPYDMHAPILSNDEWRPAQSSAGSGESRGGSAADPAPAPDTDAPRSVDGGARGPSEQHLAAGESAYTSALAALDVIPSMVAEGDGVGSNSWVVSGEHTESGLPLLANDPHLAVGQPGLWLQAGLHCRELTEECPFDVSGFTLAGVPGVIVGHNQEIAWGITNLDPDVTDFYLEDIEGERYRVDDEYRRLDTRVETIEVAGGDPVELLVRETHHGPVLSDVIDPVTQAGVNPPLQGVETSGRYDVSMAWTGLEPGRTAESIFEINMATDFEEFRAAAELFSVPSQNLVYADRQGNIGYQAPGLIPVRESSTNSAPPGYWPSPGWNSAYDWKGWVPFEQLPWTLNPDDGVIVAANQAVARSSTPFLTTEWDKGYRSQRIADLLATEIARGPLTASTMQAIQTDTYNSFADTLVPYLMSVNLGNDPFYSEPRRLLDDWNRTAPAGDGEQGAAAMYFYVVWAHLLELTVDDELPLDLHATGNSRWMLMVENLLERPEDPWWDDNRTPGVVETRDEVLRQAMIDARLQLTRDISKNPADWQWGRLHQVHLDHPVLGEESVPGVVRSFFNRGPYAAPGGSALVDAFSWDAGQGSFEVTAGPSMRMVVDLGDLDASTWVNQTGNSGHAFHPHYDDQTEAWLAGLAYPWSFTREAVEAREQHRLVLTPED
jgi:penicillin G amidase